MRKSSRPIDRFSSLPFLPSPTFFPHPSFFSFLLISSSFASSIFSFDLFHRGLVIGTCFKVDQPLSPRRLVLKTKAASAARIASSNLRRKLSSLVSEPSASLSISATNWKARYTDRVVPCYTLFREHGEFVSASLGKYGQQQGKRKTHR